MFLMKREKGAKLLTVFLNTKTNITILPNTPVREFLCFVRNLVNKAKKINRVSEGHLGQAQSKAKR